MFLLDKVKNWLKQLFKSLFGKEEIYDEGNILKEVGRLGEREVNYVLGRLGNGYTVLSDLYIPKRNGGLSQIDHLVVSEKGIFVIETKYYSGVVVGTKEGVFWNHTNHAGRSHEMYNPFKQNEGHIKALSDYLGIDERMFIGIVVFVGDVELSKEIESEIARLWEIENIVKSSGVRVNYSVGMVIKKLRKLHTTEKEKKQHIKDIERKTSHKYGKCPECGNPLVLRNGKYGEFIGCSAYPKCMYTKKK